MNPEDINEHKTTVPAGHGKRNAIVWLATALAVAAWCMLLWSNGYAALALGVLACVAAFIGAAGNSTAMRRLATSAIIASIVLIVVVTAFIIVLKIGMS